MTHDGEALIAHYEEMRRCVVAGRVRFVRHGLAVLLQSGMAAWMDTCSVCLPDGDPTTRLSSPNSETRLPDERCPALVDLLANLALNRVMEVHA